MKKRLLTLVLMLAVCLALLPVGVEAAGHEHSFATGWTYDALGHWHACTGSECTVTDISAHTDDGFAYAAHSFDSDGKCTVCGAELESEVLPYSDQNARLPRDGEDSTLFSQYYHYEGTEFIVDGSPLFDETGVAAGNNAYHLDITPKDSTVLISRLEVVVSDYGNEWYKVGISSGVKQENKEAGVEDGTTVHINNINANSFSFGGGYGVSEFSKITVYFVRTTPPCEHSFTGDYKNNGVTHQRKCVKCGEYGPAEDHTFNKHVCACGAEEVVEKSEKLLYDNGSYTSGAYKCDGTDVTVSTNHLDTTYGVTVGGSTTLTVATKDPSLKITRIEAVFHGGTYVGLTPSSGEKAEKGNVANGTTVHINNINASTFTLSGSTTATMTDFTVYYTNGELAHDFTGDTYKDNGNGKHQHKCTKCDVYDDEEAHSYYDGYCVCGAEDPGPFVVDHNKVLIKYKGAGGAIVIPEGIVAIDEGVFKNNTTITSVEIPYYDTKHVTAIGASAFEGCTNLKEVTMDSVTSSIGATAFKGCTSLKDVWLLFEAPRTVAADAFDTSSTATIHYMCVLDPFDEVKDALSACTSLTYEMMDHEYDYDDDEEAYVCQICEAVRHDHHFAYTANGNKITCTCDSTKGDCDLEDGKIILTLTAEGGTYEPGKSFTATTDDADVLFSETTGTTVGKIQYQKKNGSGWDTATETAPTSAGVYKALVTVTYDTNKTVTAEKEFTVAKATPTVGMFTFTPPTDLIYNGTDKTASVTSSVTGIGTITVNYQKDGQTVTETKNAGDYTVSISVAEADNYQAVASLTDANWKFTVTKQAVVTPTVDGKTYTGSTLTADVDCTGKPYSVTENDGGTDVGSYDVVLTLTDPANYQWMDSLVEDLTVSFWINKAENSWETDPSISDVTYGTAISPVGAAKFGTVQISYVGTGSTDYAPSDTAPTGAGTYKATFSVAETSNYGPLSKDINFTISKATVTAPMLASKVYTGNTLTADVDVSSGLYTVTTNNGGTAVGSYDVVLTLTDPDNYKWEGSTNAEMTVTFRITKTDNSWQVDPAIEDVIYGTAISPVGTPAYGTVEISYVGTGSTDYPANTTAPTDAGTYTATFTVAATDDYGTLTKDVPFTIGQREATLQWTAPADLTYDGTAKVATAEVTNLVSGDTCTVTAELVTGDDNVNVGTFNYKATALSNGNYKLPADDSISYTIVPREAELEWTAPTDLTYDGIAKELTAEVSNLVSGDTCAVTVELKTGDNVNVGSFSYTATALSNGNYKLPDPADSDTYTVEAFDLVNAQVGLDPAAYDYTGSEVTPVPTVTFDGASAIPTADYKLEYADNTDAGTATVTVTAASGNVINSKTASFEINKVEIPDGTPVSYTVNGVAQDSISLADMGITLAGTKITEISAVSGKTGNVLDGAPSVKDDGVTLAWKALGSPSDTLSDQYTVKIQTANYKEFTLTLTFSGKSEVTFQEDYVVGGGNLVYGTAYTVKDPILTVNGEAVTPDQDLVYTYYKYDDENGWTAMGSTAPVDAGTYKMAVAVSDDEKLYSGSKEYPFTVAQKTLTVTVKDKKANIGEEIPVLGEDDYTVDGLVSGDTLTEKPALSYETTPDMRQGGSFTILAEKASAGENYQIVYEKGTLTVAAGAPINYEIIEGDMSEWTKGSQEMQLIVSDAAFSKFVRVEVDGATVEPSNYTAEEGSTEIRFLPRFLEKLIIGVHTVRIVSIDGFAQTKLKIKPAEKPLPPTGDQGHLLLGVTLLLISSAAFAVVIKRNRKKNVI